MKFKGPQRVSSFKLSIQQLIRISDIQSRGGVIFKDPVARQE